MKLINALAYAVVLTMSFASLNVAAADTAKKHNVVFQITDSDPVKLNQAMNSATGMQKNVGKDKINIEVVATGPGLDMLKLESPVGGRMSEAVKNGIVFVACGAAMKAMKVTEKDLLPGVIVVPGGLIEIMTKQEAGWTYLKI